MIDGASAKSTKILGKSGPKLHSRVKHLRGSIITIPFFAAALISFIYGSWQFPPAWFQDIILFSTFLCLVVVYHCRTWIYRFRAGAPMLAFSFGGAVFFPMAASLHVWEYHIIDNRLGVALGLLAWTLSTYCMYRLFQPSRDAIWNKIMERLRTSSGRWVAIVLFPLFWAGYGFCVFAFIDTQFDWGTSRAFYPWVVAKTDHLRGAGTRYYALLAPWPGEYNRSTGSEGPEVPSGIYDRLGVGGIACVTQHPGLLGARWYRVDACGMTAGT